MKQYFKDPQDILDFSFDWTEWLREATAATFLGGVPDEIVASSWSVSPAGLVIGDGSNGAPVASFSDVSSTVWVKDGTLGEFYRLTNHITTQGGRQADSTLIVQIRQR